MKIVINQKTDILTKPNEGVGSMSIKYTLYWLNDV